MKISKIEAFTKNLSLTKPYTIAYKTISDVENIFLFITLENGITGIGAANPDSQVVGENSVQVLQSCQSEFCQSFVGRDIRHFRLIIAEISAKYPGKPGTLAAWDIALHDAFGKFLGVPIVDFYGRQINSLPTSVTIGIMNVEDTVAEALEQAKIGFKVLKVKTGQTVEVDIERIAKIHEKLPEITIRVDANQGYNATDLEKFIRETEAFGLELIEQPVAVGSEDVLAQFNESDRKLFVADESLKNSASAVKFAAVPQLFGNYNIKLMKCGGLLGAFEIATVAKAANINLFWGCNDESIVSITAALHAAFACPNTRYIDLDGSLDLAEDIVTGGFVLEDGMMRISEKSGFGFELI